MANRRTRNFDQLVADRRVARDEEDRLITGAILASFPLNKLDRILEAHSTDKDKAVVKGSNLVPLRIGDNWYLIDADANVSTATDMDTGSVAAGKDYYVYACESAGSLVFKISLNSSIPSGFTADTSRKIGGFHTLCVDVGTIADNSLSGYLAGEILPKSIWDLKHRPICQPEGRVYDEGTGKWWFIYLASNTGSATASVYGAVIMDIRNWMDFNDDGHAIGIQLSTDSEFQSIAAGSNEETNIAGSADPVTTGGHSDTAGRRMISNIGCEDCCGVMWQWLLTSSARLDNGTAGSWVDLVGDKGSFLTYGTNGLGNTQLTAGGAWAYGARCGSRGRHAFNGRWSGGTAIGARFGAAML